MEDFAKPRIYEKLGLLHYEWGNFEKAREFWVQAVRISYEMGLPYSVGNGLAGLGAVAFTKGKPAHAARLLGAARAYAKRVPLDLLPWSELPLEPTRYEQIISAVRKQLGEQKYET